MYILYLVKAYIARYGSNPLKHRASAMNEKLASTASQIIIKNIVN
jgi:hypothetical protein